MRLKLKAKRRRSQQEPRHQTDRRLLEEHQVQGFASVLEEALESCTTTTVEQSWREFKDAINEAQKSLPLGPEKEENDWVTEKVREVSRMKQEAWLRWVKKPGDTILKAQYQQLKTQSRKAADEAREAWWEAKAEEAERLHEAAVRHGRGGSLLKDLRLLQWGQKLRASTALLAADGRTKLTGTAEKLERWREHFDEVCNVSTEVAERVLDTIPEVPTPETDGGSSDENLSVEPSEDKIRAAIKQLKNGRAPGVDMVTAELLKLGGETVVRWLAQLAASIWRSESVPDDWVKQLTIPLHKKGAHDHCDNFRGIALLSVPGKVFCRVIQKRLAERDGQLLRENQCGFRKGRGCIDQVFSLRVLAEKAREYNAPLYLCFVDLRKAYDSVNRDALWVALQKRYQVPDKLLRILKALHQDTRGAIRAYGKVSEEFSIKNGVRQGDVLAPTLFNLFFNAIISMALARHPDCGLKVMYNQDTELVGNRRKLSRELHLQDLEYADDMALVSDSMDLLEELLQAMEVSCSEMGLTISSKKTKILAVHPADRPSQPPRDVPLRPADDPVSVVEEFEYLGSTISADCSLDKEISSRISKASRSFNILCRVLWYQRRVKTRTKLKMFKSVILSTLLYGSETWAPTVTHVKRLQGRCVRIILEHRAESDGWPGESGGDADEKKAEVAWSCSSDGGNPHPQVPASMQAGWWQALSWWSEEAME